jgi:hypothetical protein
MIGLLYFLPFLALIILLLPLLIRVGIHRSAADGSIGYHLSAGFFLGLGGLRIQGLGNRRYLYPEIFGRPAYFLGWRFPSKSSKPPDVRPDTKPSDVSQEKKKQDVMPPLERLRRLTTMVASPAISYLLQLHRIVGGLRLRADGHVGVRDPSQTGRIYAYAHSLSALLGHRVQLRVVPNFTGPGVSGILDLRFRLHLGHLLFLTLLFAGRVGLRWLSWKMSGALKWVGSILPRRMGRWHRT